MSATVRISSAESAKMSYKTRFQPLEALGADGWAVINQEPPLAAE